MAVGCDESTKSGTGINIEANKRDMPYQSLIKAWLAEDVERHQRY